MTTCHYKREKNPKPILPKCLASCHDYSHEHRFKFYHETFDADKDARLKFLLDTSAYSYSMKASNPSFSGHYLWEQFACDLRDELYHKFLIHCYLYVMKHPKNYDELMAILQAITTLEENAITGIYYLNVSFMMWTFKFLSLRELNEYLDKMIEGRVIYAHYDIHFGNLLKLIKVSGHSVLATPILKVRDILTEPMLKGMYSEFMLGSKYRAFGQQKEILALEKSLIEFQKGFGPNVDPLTISNTGLMGCINGLLSKSGYKGEFKTGHLM